MDVWQPQAMDDVLYGLVCLALLLVPSPLLPLIDRARRAVLPASDEEGGRRAYEAWSRNQVTLDFPAWTELVEHSRETWRKVARAAYGLPVLVLVLLFASACGGPQRTPKHDLADAIDGNTADLIAFGKWDDERQARIGTRCRETSVGAIACKRRLTAYRETRDAMRVLLKRQIHTLAEATKLLGQSPEGRL